MTIMEFGFYQTSWRGVNLEAKVVTCMVFRTEIGFAILRVRVGTVELLVYLQVTNEKNVLNGHFRWYSSDLDVLYHKFVIQTPLGSLCLLLGACAIICL